jgi:ETS factor family protein
MFSSDDSGLGHQPWGCSNPLTWSHWQVQDWLKKVSVECNNYVTDANFLDLDGAAMAQMTLEDFLYRDRENGGMLYNEFQQLLYPQMLYPQQNILPNFPEFSDNENLDSFHRLLQAYSISGDERLPSLPSLPVDPAAVQLKKPMIKQESKDSGVLSPPPSPAASDVSSCSDVSVQTARPKKEKGKGKLWEFIRDLLLNDETCPSIIKWENRAEGIFRIVKSDQVAKLWGKRKCNKTMTYEKMSRAMRYYYKKGVLERIECRRLVYKFGNRSRGWQA